jgi:hypothetical protein
MGPSLGSSHGSGGTLDSVILAGTPRPRLSHSEPHLVSHRGGPPLSGPRRARKVPGRPDLRPWVANALSSDRVACDRRSAGYTHRSAILVNRDRLSFIHNTYLIYSANYSRPALCQLAHFVSFHYSGRAPEGGDSLIIRSLGQTYRRTSPGQFSMAAQKRRCTGQRRRRGSRAGLDGVIRG